MPGCPRTSWNRNAEADGGAVGDADRPHEVERRNHGAQQEHQHHQDADDRDDADPAEVRRERVLHVGELRGGTAERRRCRRAERRGAGGQHLLGATHDGERTARVRIIGAGDVEAGRGLAGGHERVDRLAQVVRVRAGQRGGDPDVVRPRREDRAEGPRLARQGIERVLGLPPDLPGARGVGEALGGQRGIGASVEVVRERIERAGEIERSADRRVFLERTGRRDAVLPGVEGADLREGAGQLGEVVGHHRVGGAARPVQSAGGGRRRGDRRGERPQLRRQDCIGARALDDVLRVRQACLELAHLGAGGHVRERHAEAVHVGQGTVQAVRDRGIEQRGGVRPVRAVLAGHLVGD